MENSKHYKKWSSRKLWIATALQATITALLVFGYIPANIYRDLTIVVFGGYFASNVAQKGILK